MKSLFKKYFFIFAVMCIAVTCIATFGYADFVFNTADISNGIGSSNNSITQTADPIRQNAVFGEAGDASASGTQYYDVYFMAQAINGGAKDTNGDGILDNYYYLPIPDNYSGEEADVDGLTHFGAFYGENGESLTDDISQDVNRYFKKVENVAELSIEQMNEIGTPRTNRIFDSRSHSGTVNVDKWPIQFLCWTISSEPIYTANGYSWPSDGQLRGINGSTWLSYYSTWEYTVTGYYPTKSSTFTTFYTNNLLSIYDDYAVTINGKKSIFVYPVYTVGKSYIAYDSGKSYECVDSVTLRTYDTNQTQLELQTFIYDGSLSSSLNTSGSNFSVFRLDNVLFDSDTYSNYKYTIHVDRSPWIGNRYIVTDGLGENNSSPQNNELPYFFGDAYNVGQGSGRYNIYLISKSNNMFSNDDRQKIDTMFDNNNIQIYYEKELDYMNPNDNPGSRDYYIVYERIYEPRLIGGTTGSFSYNDNYNYVFTRVGPTGEEKNHYVLRSALLDPNKITSFVYDGITRNINNNYFAVQLLPEDGMGYDELVLPEDNINNTDWPKLTVSDQNGNNQVIPYLTDSLIGKDAETSKLVRTNDSSNSGLYSLYIKVNYSANSEGRNVPSSIEIYAYQFNDMYINVYDGGESTIVYHREDTDLTNIDETGYLTSAACALRMINLKQGSTLTADTPLTYYQEVDGQWEVVKEGDSNKTKPLSTYLSEIESVGDCLKELVTGKYITLENYTSFVIDKNYAFVRCVNPYASNQGGVTA